MKTLNCKISICLYFFVENYYIKSESFLVYKKRNGHSVCVTYKFDNQLLVKRCTQ